MTLMWDPQPARRPGILTAGELAACKRVLESLREPACASTLLAAEGEDLDAFLSLARAGYVESVPARAPTKTDAPFRWDRIRATPAGLLWLEQVAS